MRLVGGRVETRTIDAMMSPVNMYDTKLRPVLIVRVVTERGDHYATRTNKIGSRRVISHSVLMYRLRPKNQARKLHTALPMVKYL